MCLFVSVPSQAMICVFVCVCPKSSHDLCVCLCLSQVKPWSVCLFVPVPSQAILCVFVCVCPKSSHDLCVCLCLSQVKAWSVCLFVSHLISQSSCLKKNIVNHLLSCVKIKEKFTIKNKKSNDLTISMRNFDKIQKKFVLLLYLQKTFNIMQIIF